MARTTPRTLTLAAATAAACLMVSPAGTALAASTIIGGHAQRCSTDALAEVHTPEAIDNCTDALLQDVLDTHSRAATLANRATMFVAVKSYDLALRDVDQAVTIEPGLGAAYVNRGAALIGLGRFPEAEAQLDKGLALNPERPERAYANRGLARWHLENFKGAYEDFMKASELKPSWAWPKEQLTHFTVARRPAAAQ